MSKIIKALAAFTVWTGTEMKVFNVGDVGELSDAHADQYVEANLAVIDGDAPEADDGDAKAELLALKKEDLLATAKAEGVTIEASATKDVIADAILAARAAGAPPA